MRLSTLLLVIVMLYCQKVLFWTVGRVGSGRTGRGLDDNNTNSAQLELGLGLSLATTTKSGVILCALCRHQHKVKLISVILFVVITPGFSSHCNYSMRNTIKSKEMFTFSLCCLSSCHHFKIIKLEQLHNF